MLVPETESYSLTQSRLDYRTISFSEPLQISRSFIREIPSRAFREWPIAIKRNETAAQEGKERMKERERWRKKGQSERVAAASSVRETTRGCEEDEERERREHAHRAGT